VADSVGDEFGDGQDHVIHVLAADLDDLSEDARPPPAASGV